MIVLVIVIAIVIVIACIIARILATHDNLPTKFFGHLFSFFAAVSSQICSFACSTPCDPTTFHPENTAHYSDPHCSSIPDVEVKIPA